MSVSRRRACTLVAPQAMWHDAEGNLAAISLQAKCVCRLFDHMQTSIDSQSLIRLLWPVAVEHCRPWPVSSSKVVETCHGCALHLTCFDHRNGLAWSPVSKHWHSLHKFRTWRSHVTSQIGVLASHCQKASSSRCFHTKRDLTAGTSPPAGWHGCPGPPALHVTRRPGLRLASQQPARCCCQTRAGLDQIADPAAPRQLQSRPQPPRCCSHPTAGSVTLADTSVYTYMVAAFRGAHQVQLA
jgi:hypothetical protein